MKPETKYAKSGDVHIAYQVVGDGPIDLVFVMGWVSHLDYLWDGPAARFLNRFVPGAIAWAHVDLAAAQRTGGLAHVATDITGFGVRYAINLLMDQALLERAQREQ